MLRLRPAAGGAECAGSESNERELERDDAADTGSADGDDGGGKDGEGGDVDTLL